MLAQFGRTIFDVLVALELAVRESHEDRYAQQLEPELGHLVADIQSGFQYLAKCIHGWRFHIPPPNLNLEEDIAQLEDRMAKVRHTSSNFSQAEILRAYALQLHLKQIARLLRSSRVETSRAIGEAQTQRKLAEKFAQCLGAILDLLRRDRIPEPQMPFPLRSKH